MERRRSGRPGRALGYVVIGILGAVVGGAIGGVAAYQGAAALPIPGVRRAPLQPYREVVDRGQPVALGETVVQVVKKVGPAVISIDTLSRVGNRGFPGFGGDALREGQGSGFIINGRERLAVSNNHVVENAQRIRVTLGDKRTFGATVVGTDPIGDIALLRLDGNGTLPEIQFGDSDQLEIGQVTVAIGNPLGLANTVTQGVLSAIGRRLPEGRMQGIPLEDLIQTDAAINPGNSGGPLLDAYGRVIGMNTAILSQAQGIGFAVAANRIKRSVEDLLQHGRVIRPWLGISMVATAELPREQAVQMGITRADTNGIVIMEVLQGAPAAAAGLELGDLITHVQDQRIETPEDVRSAITALRPGDRVTLKGFRGDAAKTWTVTLGEMPAMDQLRR
ncbi:MAG: S1C family serine protease [Armatimonadota bacterium]